MKGDNEMTENELSGRLIDLTGIKNLTIAEVACTACNETIDHPTDEELRDFNRRHPFWDFANHTTRTGVTY